MRLFSSAMKIVGFLLVVCWYVESGAIVPWWAKAGLLILLLSWYVLDYHYFREGRKVKT